MEILQDLGGVGAWDMEKGGIGKGNDEVAIRQVEVVTVLLEG